MSAAFWDTSALLPLVFEDEIHTPAARDALARSEEPMAVWWGTSVEAMAGVARRERNLELSRDQARRARQALRQILASCDRVEPSETVLEHALALLRRHPLRSADALQLAAALAWAGGPPGELGFFCFDRQLSGAAAAEGFVLLEGDAP